MNLIERIIKQLQVPQKPWYPPKSEEPDLKPFAVDFEYLGRCLHRLGANFQDMKIMDLKQPTFGHAVLYCLLGHDPDNNELKVDFGDRNNQEICDLLGINVLEIGPDELQYSYWITENCKSPRPYVILFHSYDNLYYPIISLEQRDDYVFYRKSNNILEQFLPESEE